MHAKDIYFRPLRSKPRLTADDVRERLSFATKYAPKAKAWWTRHINMHIDMQRFPVLLHGEARARAASEGTRGAYRAPGQGLAAPYVRTDKRMKYNPGAKGVHVLAGVGPDRVLLWEYMDSQRWCGAVAAGMYEGPILSALRAAFPGRRQWRVLEDNDPAGFKSSRGVAAKRKVGIVPFEIPRRSPGLNICDYALWSEINRRMRRQERRWPARRRETRSRYLQRLRQTAMRLPARFIASSIEDMRRRCQRLLVAKGNNFEEGGRRPA